MTVKHLYFERIKIADYSMVAGSSGAELQCFIITVRIHQTYSPNFTQSQSPNVFPGQRIVDRMRWPSGQRVRGFGSQQPTGCYLARRSAFRG